jgi:aminoglycoside phosphotransferase (APT) family kinase protein
MPVRWERVRGSGYGTNTAKWSVELDDGRRVFIKLALDELATDWLRDEWRVYSSLSAGFLPEPVAWHDTSGTTFLAIEDLAGAYWPPPWLPGHVSLVLETLGEIHAATPPRDLPFLADLREALDGWPVVAADPEPFLSTGVCSREWLAAALPHLVQASSACRLAGEALVHLDLRGDNLCIRDGRVIVIDWNHACIGNPAIDVVGWAPSLSLEGGPDPWELVPESDGLAALIAGFFAARAGLPAPATAPTVRAFQRRQAEVALPWAARELGLAAG